MRRASVGADARRRRGRRRPGAPRSPSPVLPARPPAPAAAIARAACSRCCWSWRPSARRRVFAGVTLIQWTETADFCGRCHTMAPELAAYHAGPHRDVSCGECHVEPGIAGWVKAKIERHAPAGERRDGHLPHAHPAARPRGAAQDGRTPARSATRSTTGSSRTCARGRSSRRTRRTRASSSAYDPARRRRRRSTSTAASTGTSCRDVELPLAGRQRRDDRLRRRPPDDDGTRSEYIAQRQDQRRRGRPAGHRRHQGRPSRNVTINCYDCHNRVGPRHPEPAAQPGLPAVHGRDRPTLPYIKREGMRILWTGYPDEATADAEIDKLARLLQAQLPGRVRHQGRPDRRRRSTELKVLYRLTATPEMKVTAATYPDHMGHTDFPGCFRCHDGGHFKVENGVATKKTIPSTCDTCHTFPQIGPAVASLPAGRAAEHAHRRRPVGVQPQERRDVRRSRRPVLRRVPRPRLLRELPLDGRRDRRPRHDGHQPRPGDPRARGTSPAPTATSPRYCARCHAEPVLPVTSPAAGGAEEGWRLEPPAGLAFPLAPPG